MQIHAYQKQAAWLWAAALFFSIPWLPSLDTEFFILTSLCLFAAIVASFLSSVVGLPTEQRGHGEFFISAVLAVGILFWLNVIRSVFTSDVPMVAWGYAVYFSALPLSILYFLVGKDSAFRLRYAFKPLLLLLLALFLYGVYQYIFMRETLHNGRVKAPLADPNALGALFSFGLFAGLALIPLAQNKAGSVLVTIMAAAGLLMTGSRGAMAAAFLMACVYFYGTRHYWFGKQGQRYIFIGIIAAILLLVISALTAPNDATGFYHLLRLSVSGSLPLIGERVHIWQAAFGLVRDHFWLGTGIGTFFLYYPSVRLPLDQSAGFMAHNDVLQMAVETGVLSAILCAVFMVCMAVRTIKALRVPVSVTEEFFVLRVQVVAGFCAFMAMFIHAQVTFNFYVLPLLVVAGFSFSVWYFATGQLLQEKPFIVRSAILQRWPGDTIKAFIVIPCVLLAILAVLPPVSQRMVQMALKAAQNGDVVRFSHLINLSDRVAFGLNGQSYLSAATVPLGILATRGEEMSAAEKEKLEQQALMLLDRAQQVNPRMASEHFYRGWLAFLMAAPEDRLDQEIVHLQTGLRLDPLHLPSRIRLMTVLWEAGRKDQAKAIIGEGLPWLYSGQNPMPFYVQASYFALADNDMALHLAVSQAMDVAKQSAQSYVPNPMGKAVRDVIAAPQ